MQHAHFLFCSADDVLASKLGQVLASMGVVAQELPPMDILVRRVGEIAPQVIFLDFVPNPEDPEKLTNAAERARVLAYGLPQIPCVAVGHLSSPDSAVAALRGGVRDFVDAAHGSEIMNVAQRLLGKSRETEDADDETCACVAVLDARPGLGASTLAAHVADLWQAQISEARSESSEQAAKRNRTKATGTMDEAPLSDRVCVVDLGWPVADSLLYLNTHTTFDFVEAVGNLRRLDPTLLNAAMARTEAGVHALPLPRDLSRMRNVALPECLLLIDRLRQYYAAMVIDAGGLAEMEFVAGIVRIPSAQIWILVDQSVAALVSLSELLQELESRKIERSRLRLVINRYDARYGLSSEQIAERFDLKVAGVIPDRTLSLMISANQGELLHANTDRDPYIKAVQGLMAKLGAGVSTAKASSRGWRWGKSK